MVLGLGIACGKELMVPDLIVFGKVQQVLLMIGNGQVFLNLCIDKVLLASSPACINIRTDMIFQVYRVLNSMCQGGSRLLPPGLNRTPEF